MGHGMTARALVRLLCTDVEASRHPSGDKETQKWPQCTTDTQAARLRA